MRERFGRADGLWCAWQSELIKAVTSPGLLATVLGGLASAALLGALVRVGDDPAAWRTAVASWLVVAPVGAGALIAGEEYHSGQVATTLTATPQRVVALVAKTVVAAVVLAVLASGAVVLTVAADPASAPTWREAVAFLATLWWPGLLAYGLALALRGILPAVAVVLSTLWLLPRALAGAPRLLGLTPAHASADLLAGQSAAGQLTWLIWILVALGVGALRWTLNDA